MKSPGVAVVLSFFLPGLGSLYAEEYGAGFGLLLLWAVSLVLAIPTLGLLPLIVWIIGMVAAHNNTQAYNVRTKPTALGG